MNYRRLGDAGMKVSTVSLGGWINYGEGKVAEDAAHNVIETAYENGINFFDIADIYGRGGAETQMGKVLRQYDRHTLVVSSKVFWPMSDDVNDKGLSRKHIMESIEKTLNRLEMDYIDIYFCHRPDPETPMLETARAMHTLVEQGKILYWGTSEWTGQQLTELYAVCEKHNLHYPKTEQPQYSMLWRDSVENDVLPVTEPRGMGLVVWSPLAQGMLTGKYDDGIPENSRFAREDWARKRIMNETNSQKVKDLKPIADELGISRAQLALAWCLRNSGVSSVIIGATKPEQVVENVEASDAANKLTPEIADRIEAILNPAED